MSDDRTRTWPGDDPGPMWRPVDDDDADTSPEVERLAEDIETTRHGMNQTLDELGERLDPANVVANAKENVREATIGKVEQMATTAGDKVSEAGAAARETGEGLIETIRRNPIPAAMAGVGLGWLWLNRDRGQRRMTWPATSSARVSRYQGANERSLGERIGDVGEGVGRTASSVATNVGDTASSVASNVGEAASDVADRARMTAQRARTTADDATYQVGEAAQDVGETAQRIFDENPLAVGAVALAVGAAVGMALPATRTEQRVIGNAGSQLLDQAESALRQPLEETERKLAKQERKARTSA